MSLASLESTVNTAFDARDGISAATRGEVREAVDHVLDLLDKGELRELRKSKNERYTVFHQSRSPH